MQVQCDVCSATLEVPAEKAGNPQLQIECRCGALVPLAARQPLAFRLVGESPASSAEERSPKPKASALRIVGSEPGTPPKGSGDGQTAITPQSVAFRLVESPPVSHAGENGVKRQTPTLRLVSVPEESGAMAVAAEATPAVPLPAQRASLAPHNKAVLAATIPAASPRPRTGKPRPGAWRQCVEHPPAKSETMCPTCAVGYCAECEKSICPTCDSPCLPASGYQAWLEQERLRARPMMDEVKTILAYPLQDPTAFFIFAAITGFFGFAALFSARAILFSWGILLWYSFHTLYQVASGNLKRFIPEFNDISDLTHPLRLSGAALTITWGPLLLLGVLFTVNIGMGINFASIMGGTSAGQEETVSPSSDKEDHALAEVQGLRGDRGDEETDSEDSPTKTQTKRTAPTRTRVPVTAKHLSTPGEATSGVSLLLLLALLWKVAYTPVALIVAALSKNVWSVLNPLIGIQTIRRMGPVYWHVLLIYSGLTVVEFGVGKMLGLLPIGGAIGMAFVKAYIAIAVGCALGLAVYKKAPELGWD